MINSQEIKNELELLSALRTIAQSYEEISVSRMKKTRDSVAKTADFLSGLSGIYADVKSRQAELKDSEQEKAKPRLPLVSVLLSANTKLYGDIIPKVYRLFLSRIKSEKTDIVIIGRLGQGMYQAEKDKQKFTYFDLPDSELTLESLKPIANFLLKYEKVDVFFGKYQTLLSQEAAFSSLTEGSYQPKNRQPKVGHFEFEPSYNKLLAFFERQFFVSLLKQTTSESQLAKYASRVRSMELALQNINEHDIEVKVLANRAKRELLDRKQKDIVSKIEFLYGE